MALTEDPVTCVSHYSALAVANSLNSVQDVPFQLSVLVAEFGSVAPPNISLTRSKLPAATYIWFNLNLSV